MYAVPVKIFSVYTGHPALSIQIEGKGKKYQLTFLPYNFCLEEDLIVVYELEEGLIHAYLDTP
jgi:hypothetical protein